MQTLVQIGGRGNRVLFVTREAHAAQHRQGTDGRYLVLQFGYAAQQFGNARLAGLVDFTENVVAADDDERNKRRPEPGQGSIARW